MYSFRYANVPQVGNPRPSTTTPRLFNRPVVGKTTLLNQKSQKIHYYIRTVTKLAKAYLYLLL